MEQTWRWFGPEDAIPLAHVRQAGATGIVTALHQIPYGVVWSVEDIQARQRLITADPSLGLKWSVVESLPIHEQIKLGAGNLKPLFDNYRQSLRNLAACGVQTVCYNFMPILDWTRTDLGYPMAGGGRALKFDACAYAAFDCFMVERVGAEADHAPEVVARARVWFDRASESSKSSLLATIMAGLPGAFDRYDIAGLRTMLDRYKGFDATDLQSTLKVFLSEVIPTAEEYGIRMCIHPDDPPRPLLGLARIVSNADDLQFIVDAVPSTSNGITFCTGSLGAGAHNDVAAMASRFAPHIQFAHLRNVTKAADGSFVEAEHLGGDVDMVAVVAALLGEQARRKATSDPRWRIPFRPDHGHELLDDPLKKTHPGYPAVGRLKGLAEIRGVMTALSAVHGHPL